MRSRGRSIPASPSAMLLLEGEARMLLPRRLLALARQVTSLLVCGRDQGKVAGASEEQEESGARAQNRVSAQPSASPEFRPTVTELPRANA